MRLLVFLLVAANLLFFAWTEGIFGQGASPDTVRLSQEIAPEKLSIVSRDKAPTPAPTPASPRTPPPEQAPPPETCLAWVSLQEADAGKIEKTLSEDFATLKRVRHTVPEPGSWWVYIPPLANKAEVNKKLEELKNLKVPEYFVINESGPNHFAISLGIFSSEAAAAERLATLKQRGIKNAKSGRRLSARAELTLEISGLQASVESAKNAIQQLLPEARAAACSRDS